MGDGTPAGHNRYGPCIKRTVRALDGLDCFHHMMYDLSQAMRCLGQPCYISAVPLSLRLCCPAMASSAVHVPGSALLLRGQPPLPART